MTPFAEALAGWHDFYLLVGTAAATLMGLLFVGLSFGIGAELERRREGIDAFVTPTMVHFIQVFVVAVASVAPIASASTLAILLGLMVVLNVQSGLRRVRQLHTFHREDPFDWRDWLAKSAETTTVHW